MTDLYNNLEQWLVAERRQMSRAGALTSFLADKADMLQSVGFKPEDSRNTGAAKSRSHIGQCKQRLQAAELPGISHADKCRHLGILASKALKVASGYGMRAGYFHPDSPKDLYQNRMIHLAGADNHRLPVLGMSLSALEEVALNHTKLEAVQAIDDIELLLQVGEQAAGQADIDLRELLLKEKQRDAAFSGSVAAQLAADTLTTATKSMFVAAGIGALHLQGDGPDGLGPIILEPKSDADTRHYLRTDSIRSTTMNQITFASSLNMVER